MDSLEILMALRRKYPAVLPEITVVDLEYEQYSFLSYPDSPFHLARVNPNFIFNEKYDINKAKHFRRIDALIMDSKNYIACEIKVSRADFFADTFEKRAPWRRHTNRFVYVTPPGLVLPSEVPEGCGLWEIHDGLPKSKKPAKVNKNPEPFPNSFWKTVFWRATKAPVRIGDEE